jgi:hypothetical protein
MIRSTRIIIAAIATFAIVAPAATAMPSRDTLGATSASPQQDRRGADARDASMTPQTATIAPGKDFRSPDARDAGTTAAEPVLGLPTWPVNPEPIARAPLSPAVVAHDGTSPFAYVLPGVLVSLLLVAGMAYAVRTSVRARRARISI